MQLEALLDAVQAAGQSRRALPAPRRIFGLCLQGLLGGPSSWDLGVIDSRKHKGALRWLPILHESCVVKLAESVRFQWRSSVI